MVPRIYFTIYIYITFIDNIHNIYLYIYIYIYMPNIYIYIPGIYNDIYHNIPMIPFDSCAHEGFLLGVGEPSFAAFGSKWLSRNGMSRILFWKMLGFDISIYI